MKTEALVELAPITLEKLKTYYREFERDEAIFADISRFSPYVYDENSVEKYYEKIMSDPKRVNFLIEADGKAVGEIALKHIDREKGSAELSIHLQNDKVKGRGFGTAAERLLIEKAKDMGLKKLSADAVLKNSRSRHVLEKVGFIQVSEDETFAYYVLEM